MTTLATFPPRPHVLRGGGVGVLDLRRHVRVTERWDPVMRSSDGFDVQRGRARSSAIPRNVDSHVSFSAPHSLPFRTITVSASGATYRY
jgi:hypothetical protein